MKALWRNGRTLVGDVWLQNTISYNCMRYANRSQQRMRETYKLSKLVHWQLYRDNVTIASEHPKHQDVDQVFCSYQYKYEFIARLTPKHTEMFVLMLPAVQHDISKFLEEEVVSLCCLPHRWHPTDSSLLHSRQNLKQIKYMLKTKNSAYRDAFITPFLHSYINHYGHLFTSGPSKTHLFSREYQGRSLGWLNSACAKSFI